MQSPLIIHGNGWGGDLREAQTSPVRFDTRVEEWKTLRVVQGSSEKFGVKFR
jgi:hypothetical protein